MAASIELMECYNRYQQVELFDDTRNGIIKTLFTVCQRLEAAMARQATELDDTKLELEDARKSRRELQRELGLANQTIDRFNINYDSFMVGERLADLELDADSLQNRNPYVIVLIDGDGMIVSLP
jgi:hypothetical protein